MPFSTVLAVGSIGELLFSRLVPSESFAMRRLGTLSDTHSASLLHDYLYATGIQSKVERDGSEWAIWIHDEDHVKRAREEFAKFRENPTDPRYAAEAEKANALREQRVNADITARKQQIQMAQRWAGVQTHIPITAGLILLSILVAIVTRIGMDEIAASNFMFAGVHFNESVNRIVYDSIWGVFAKGQYYRLIAPIFLHFGPLHLLFNMSATLTYGRAIEQRSGSWRFLGIVLVIALVSNFSQYLQSGPSFGGMSGVDFGLFGFLWMKSKFATDYGVYVGRDYVIRFFLFGMLCVFGLIGNVANTAHFSGLMTGMGLALIPLIPRIWRRYVTQR